MTPQRLRLELNIAAGRATRAGLIDREAFTDVLATECNPAERRRTPGIGQLADMFSEPRGNSVDYEQFLVAFASWSAMRATLAYLFGQLDVLCAAEKAPDFQSLLLRYAKGATSGSLSAAEAESAFRSMHISLSAEEVNMLMIEYDATGQGRFLDVKQLEADLAAWRTEEFKKKLTANRTENYSKFDQYYNNTYASRFDDRGGAGGQSHHNAREEPASRDRPTSQGRRELPQVLKDAARTYQAEFQEIIDALQSRHSGAHQWFRTHAPDGKSLRLEEWNQAIQALGLPPARGRQASPSELFRAMTPRGEVQVLLETIADLLSEVQSVQWKPKVSEEATLEQLIRGFKGDDRFLERAFDRMDKEARLPVTIRDWA